MYFQNRLYAQRRRYLTQYVQRYPLPARDTPEARQIVRLVRRIVNRRPDSSELTSIENDIDRAVVEAFGLTADEAMGISD